MAGEFAPAPLGGRTDSGGRPARRSWPARRPCPGHRNESPASARGPAAHRIESIDSERGAPAADSLQARNRSVRCTRCPARRGRAACVSAARSSTRQTRRNPAVADRLSTDADTSSCALSGHGTRAATCPGPHREAVAERYLAQGLAGMIDRSGRSQFTPTHSGARRTQRAASAARRPWDRRIRWPARAGREVSRRAVAGRRE